MNSNKTAAAVAILAGAVIGSCLWISSRTEPAAPSVSGEPELNTEAFAESSAATSVEASFDVSDVLSDAVVPEVSVPEAEESSEPEAEVSTPSESQPEEEDPVRDPMGTVTEEKFHVSVTVTDEEGFPIEGAIVSIDDVPVGRTNANGFFYAETENEDFILHIVSEVYVSYYEELNHYEIGSEVEISLKKADMIRRLLNSAELRPYVAYDEDLDSTVRALLDSLIEPGMDTYDKVKACYDWLIANTEYKRPHHNGSGHWPCAFQTIDEGIGTCNCYSAAFAAMMRYIGLECYVVEGTTSASGGGMTGHVWTVIRLDGEFYIFDPQVEDAMADRTSSKEVTYVRFCLPEPNRKYVYSVRSQKRYIEKFDAYLLENGYFTDPPEEPEVPETPEHKFENTPGKLEQAEEHEDFDAVRPFAE